MISTSCGWAAFVAACWLGMGFVGAARAEGPRLVETDGGPVLAEGLPARPERGPLFAPTRWTRDKLVEMLGSPTRAAGGGDTWDIDGTTLVVSWYPEGAPESAVIWRDEAKPQTRSKGPVRATKVPAALRELLQFHTQPMAWLGRPSTALDVLAVGDARSLPGWLFETGEGRVFVKQPNAQAIVVEWPLPAAHWPKTGRAHPWPRGTWRWRPPAGHRGNVPVVESEQILPPGLAPGMGVDAVVAVLGPPLGRRVYDELTWPGLGLRMGERGLEKVTMRGAAALIATPGNLAAAWVRALQPEMLRARLGPATGYDAALDVAHWIFENTAAGGGLVHLRHESGDVLSLEWSFVAAGRDVDDAPCPAVCPVPTAGDRRRARLLSGLSAADCRKAADATCGWRSGLQDSLLEPTFWSAWDRDGGERLAHIDPLNAAVIRARWPDDPVANALGEPPAVWIERFGPPDHGGSGGPDRSWSVPVHRDGDTFWVRVTASDSARRGVIDLVQVVVTEDATPRLLSGFDVFAPARGVAVFGPPDAPGRWNAGVSFDATTNTVVFEGADTVALVRWLRQKGLGGPALDALGRNLFEARKIFAEKEAFVEAEPGNDGQSWTLKTGTLRGCSGEVPQPTLTLGCAGALLECRRLELTLCRPDGPARRTP